MIHRPEHTEPYTKNPTTNCQNPESFLRNPPPLVYRLEFIDRYNGIREEIDEEIIIDHTSIQVLNNDPESIVRISLSTHLQHYHPSPSDRKILNTLSQGKNQNYLSFMKKICMDRWSFRQMKNSSFFVSISLLLHWWFLAEYEANIPETALLDQISSEDY